MAKQDMTERIKEVMYHSEMIRNIAIIAHIHHGKCVSPEARIALADGNFVKAENLFNDYSKLGKIIKKDTETVIDIEKLGLNVFSLNKKTLKIEKKPIKYLWKLHGGDVLNIEVENGSAIKTTPEHKFLVFSNGIKEKSAEGLKEGDFIVYAKNIENHIATTEEMKLQILQSLSTDTGFYGTLNKEFANTIREKILINDIKKIWGQIKSHLSLKSFYHSIYHGKMRIKDICSIADIFNISKGVIYNEITSISYRAQLNRYGRTSVSLKLPKIEDEFKKFFYIVGLLTGDGSFVNLTNSDAKIQQKFMEYCKSMGLKPHLDVYKDRAPRIRSGGGFTLLNLLSLMFNYPKKFKAHKVSISEFLFKSPSEYGVEFLKGYFDTDGTVEKSRRAVSLTSVSRQMIKDLQLFLLRYGCVSIARDDTLYISGKSAQVFSEKIGFTHEGKTKRLTQLLEKVECNKLTDIVPFSPASLKTIRESLGMKKSDVPHGYYNYENSSLVPSFYSLNNFASVFSAMPNSESIEDLQFMNSVLKGDVCFIKVSKINRSKEPIVYDFTVPENGNFIAEGFVIHNTTLTDNLVAGAGMIASDLAGEAMFTWIDEQERQRELTIYGANVSMVHEYDNKDYLINLMDTPGHVDFGGDVTRAVRSVDGAVVVVDAVEGTMPQTEIVLRQALKERVKPVIFINKTDRLITELKLTPEQMIERFEKILANVNILIQKYAEEEFLKKWGLPNIKDGSVAFGSAYHNWAISMPFMIKTGVTFKDIIDLTNSGKKEELKQKAPMYKVILDMVVRHLPNPVDAQKYRVPKIWKGDLESQAGKDMLDCNINGKPVAMITKMFPDPHTGFVACARILSGKLTKGQEVYLIGQHKTQRIQLVTIYKGIQRIPVDEVVAGNIAGLVGLQDAFSGETVCDPMEQIEPFEEIKHLFEPVVTKAIEPESTKDLSKLIDFLRQLHREDPTIQIKINQETGEYLVSGLGELHIDAKVERKLRENNIPIRSSPPIVVYRESCGASAGEVDGKSPNKHNRLIVVVSPMEEAVVNAMRNREIGDSEMKRKDVDMIKKLETLGFDKNEAKNIKTIYNKNMFIDGTKGIQYLNEAMELIKEGFKSIMDEGPLSKEPCMSLKVVITDATLHEDAVHRGPAQMLPAIRFAIKEGILRGDPYLMEPKQIIRVDIPKEHMGGAIHEIQNRRGQVLDMAEERGASVITAKVPVAEMFGFDSALKSATGGHGFYSLVDVMFERIPKDLQDKVVLQIRKRKGMTEEIPKPES